MKSNNIPKHESTLLLIVIWSSLLPLIILCLSDYFTKKIKIETDSMGENVVTSLSNIIRVRNLLSDCNSYRCLSADIRNNNSINCNKINQSTHNISMGISHELLRHRVVNYIHEIRHTLTILHDTITRLHGLNHTHLNAENISSIQTTLIHFEKHSQEITTHLEINLKALGQLDGFSRNRVIGLNKLAHRLQKRIHHTQNPPDCKAAEYLTFDFTNNCGVGCTVHQTIFCLQLALETGRVLILNKIPAEYATFKWLEVNMLPLSDKCNHNDVDNKLDNMRCPYIRYGFPNHKWMPHVLPRDMAEELARLHETPFVWFAGQLAAYILRPKPQLAQHINETLKRLKSDDHPVVGVHVRRTDKINKEATAYTLSEYMNHVENFFNLRSTTLQTMARINNMNKDQHGSSSKETMSAESLVETTRSVYLSTDEPEVFNEFTSSYPQYILYGNSSKSMSASLDKRYTSASLDNAIVDIVALSMTDYLVCTFSSNMCRLAYELMQVRHDEVGDATQLSHSLDIGYHNEDYSRLKYDVIISDGERHLNYGDKIESFINRWRGSATVMPTHSPPQSNSFLAPAYKFRPQMKMSEFLWFDADDLDE
ncbi:Alpha-(1,6)-fucosyltransferase [Schistosoma japonicum]|nr:Alpha-(1,6)-fucosyltransferase [Schistosoma japonicum]